LSWYPLALELVELDEASGADDQQEDDDEDRDEATQQRLCRQQLLIGRTGEQPGMSGDGGPPREPDPR